MHGRQISGQLSVERSEDVFRNLVDDNEVPTVEMNVVSNSEQTKPLYTRFDYRFEKLIKIHLTHRCKTLRALKHALHLLEALSVTHR